ncbi:uncharacterized protein LOC144178035 isoform X2 [Haemaphysalis longicornis]
MDLQRFPLLACLLLAVNGAANHKINMEVKPVEYSVNTAKSSATTVERSLLSGDNLFEGLQVTERRRLKSIFM